MGNLISQTKAITQKSPFEAFAEFLNLEVALGNASLKTLQIYKSQLKCFLTWCNERKVNLENCTRQDIKSYREHLIIHEYAPISIALKLTVVRRFFDGMVEHGLRIDNPALKVAPPKDKKSTIEKIKYLSEENAIQTLKGIDSNDDKGKRDLAMVVLMLQHGLRCCEIERLTQRDVDISNNKLVALGKGLRPRTIFLTEKSKTILDAWLTTRKKLSPTTNKVFLNFHHDKSLNASLSERGIRKIVDSYLKKAGVKKEGFSCHSLRHTFATTARRKGAGIEFIQDQLGHADLKTTGVYAKIVAREQNNPAKFLDFLHEEQEKTT